MGSGVSAAGRNSPEGLPALPVGCLDDSGALTMPPVERKAEGNIAKWPMLHIFTKKTNYISEELTQSTVSSDRTHTCKAYPGRGLAPGTRGWETQLRRQKPQQRSDLAEAVAAVDGKLAPGTRNWEVTLRRASLRRSKMGLIKKKGEGLPRTSRDLSPHGDNNPQPLAPQRQMSVLSTHSVSSFCSLESHESHNSSDLWYSPHETLILLDWDDTICPTTSCCSESVEQPDLSDAQGEALRRHQEAVLDYLTVCSKHGRVIIVTMALEVWVKQCIAKLMPEVEDLLFELQIEVVSARATLGKHLLRSAFSDNRDPSQFSKMKAMERVINKFYKKGDGRRPSKMSSYSCESSASRKRSWKNIISIGDSVAERLALQDLVFRRMQHSNDGVFTECRCKTLLLTDSPTLDQLTIQMGVMKRVMPALVQFDGDMHVDFTAEDLYIPLET